MLHQWIVLAVFCLMLATDHLVFWRGFERRVGVDPVRARRTLWIQWISMLWACSALVLWLWVAQGLPFAALSLQMATGWRLWVPLALVAALSATQFSAGLKIARLPDRAKLRERIGSTGNVLPHDVSELPLFMLLALSAGFCEELLCRGFVIWVFQPLVGWWIGAAVSLALFTLGHIYQGKDGMIRCAALGGAMTLLVALTHSLWPSIALHAAIDVMSGWIGWQIFRDRATSPQATEQAPSP